MSGNIGIIGIILDTYAPIRSYIPQFRSATHYEASRRFHQNFRKTSPVNFTGKKLINLSGIIDKIKEGVHL